MADFIIKQFYFFIIFFSNGIIIGILFDIFRSIRKVFSVKDYIIYIQDFIFSVLVGLSLFYFIFILNNGVVRGYTFFCIIFGIIIYYYIFSQIMTKCEIWILKKINIFINFCLKVIDNFFKLVYNFLQYLANEYKIKILYSIKKTMKKKDFNFFCRKK